MTSLCAALAVMTAAPVMAAPAEAPVEEPLEVSPTASAPAGAPEIAPAAASAGETPAAASPTATPTETTPAAPATTAAPTAAPEEEQAGAAEPQAKIDFHGALEAYYAYNFNRPSNGITNWRWYDYQHNLLGLQGLWFATEWSLGPVTGHFQLQFGALAELFWGVERDVEQDLLWRLLQEATMEWKTPWRRLSLEGGLFNVPFGPEYNIVSKNWNWSGSNLFALMPYQIAGFRLNLDIGRGWIGRLGVYNGWDRIVRDNNRAKSVMGAIEWTDPDDEENYFVAEYMVGDERDRDDERGRAPRHVFDVYGQWHVARPLSLRAHTFSAIESGKQAGDGWLGGALYVKVDATEWLALVGRGDFVYAMARTENLLYSDFLDDPVTTTRLGAGTFTLDIHPLGNVSLRLEARHDRASFPLFYKGAVPLADPMDPLSYVPIARTQTTLLAGMTTWF
ncbi:MAG: outer membrane beta-barrel protein [Nannocystis sp.]|nr:outer membrane beta-barrel protein [Nannocystis sp.]